MRTLLRVTLLLAVAAAAGWYWYSPRAAVEGLRTAARQGNVEQLEQRIDFDSVRSNLKTDLRAYMAARVEHERGLLATFGLALGSVVVDQLVDAFASADGIASLTRGQVPGDVDADRAPEPEPDYQVDRQGANRFLVRFDAREGDRPVLEFDRRGLGWKLVRIRLSTASEPAADG